MQWRPPGWAVGTALLALLPGRATAGADLPSARAFVLHLYGAYHGDGPDYLGRQAGTVFAPSLLALIRRDAARTPPGEVGALDGDPICDCQDSGGLRNVTVNVVETGAGQASATVHFELQTERRTVRLDLVPVQKRWRVSDVHTADTPSLAAYLRKHSGGR